MAIFMGILILLSAFFSGSEAALFSLNSRDRKLLARQKENYKQLPHLFQGYKQKQLKGEVSSF